ncbi:ABC transporter I family member 11, chloroplastic-like isoform X1 [Chenopodium quinoa]|uniref:ABC transporter domain-containing protein n=1 Tax=Chenopodium quinoa TaxID=63459 RepID=A0A803KWL5_CHEQI|nr:ABC transporter I family member 11, chloroplastic-like isoform X1 [Chenopodium quinoa]XP_021713641.1 ABC transporter I family member 11, chloroplastic-like isoform X1 [Chenopodium quinoa]XP_021713642.1 ABC transporter I family member 11, chloroplastic-like isoform X1 [Chenopodium quinoa]
MEVSMAAHSPLIHHSNFTSTPLYSLPTNFKLKSCKNQSLRILCDHSCFEVRKLCYKPPGTQLNILNDVSFCLPQKSFGLIFGRSGSGKTTLLQLLAGLNKPTSGSIILQRYAEDGSPNQPPESIPPQRVGIVFQFPERYFLADTLLEEVTFAWPKQKGGLQIREHLASNLARALNWVGLDGVPFDKDPQSLSGGYKRRLALAIQLIQVPELLILDEPLAGLDWKARADVAKLLKILKKELTLLVVSHDLKELAPLVDRSWRMEGGGVLKEELPPL